MLACIHRGDGDELEHLTHVHYDNAKAALLAALEPFGHVHPPAGALRQGGA